MITAEIAELEASIGDAKQAASSARVELSQAEHQKQTWKLSELHVKHNMAKRTVLLKEEKLKKVYEELERELRSRPTDPLRTAN